MNMKQFLVATALVASLSTAALAATSSAPAPTDQPSKAQQQKFADRKAKILKHMGERLAKMQEKQACVQAAENAKALKACSPKKGGDHDDKSKGAKGK